MPPVKTATLIANTHTHLRRKKRNLKPMLLCIAAVLGTLVIATGIGYWFWSQQPRMVTAYEVKFGTRVVGIVQDEEGMRQAMESLRSQKSKEHEFNVQFTQDLTFAPVQTWPDYIATPDAVVKAINTFADVQTEAVAIYIDGRLATATKNEEDANWVCNQALEPLRKFVEKSQIVDIGYMEDISIERASVPASLVSSKEDAYHNLMVGTSMQRAHIVQKGETMRSIAKDAGISTSELTKANLQLSMSDYLQPGDQINLVPPHNQLNVVFEKKIMTSTNLPFKTITKMDDSMYTTQRQVLQEGKEGTRTVVAQQKYVNGIYVSEKIISEEVTQTAVDRIIVKGTKKPETKAQLAPDKPSSTSKSDDSSTSSKPSSTKKPSQSSGSASSGKKTTSKSGFIWPASGRISSTYGTRWGRLHAGLDIAASVGTPIYAAKSGTVTYSGYNSGGYGKMVKISHGGGVETRYAHCSKLVVKSGAKVDKGDLIAYVGNTGRSTGPHLHFEVRLSGSPKNPRSYLP